MSMTDFPEDDNANAEERARREPTPENPDETRLDPSKGGVPQAGEGRETDGDTPVDNLE